MIKLLKDLQEYEIGDARYEFVVMPSGSFYQAPPEINTPPHDQMLAYGSTELGFQIYNPFKIPSAEIESDLVDASPIQSLSDFVDQYKTSKKVRLINASDLSKYAESLVEMAIAIKQYPADFFLCPLRGALKPTLQLHKMNIIADQIEFLPFTRGSSGEFDDIIIKELKKIIYKFDADKQTFQINVIDTADGGYGANKLADLLRIVRRDYNKGQWLVNFFLLHPCSGDIENIERVASKSNEKIIFNVHRHVVDDLLIEDWDAAIGIKVEHDTGHLIVKNGLTSGRLILVENNSVSLIDSSEMCSYIDVLFANAISDEIKSRPDFQFYRDVYDDYINKR